MKKYAMIFIVVLLLLISGCKESETAAAPPVAPSGELSIAQQINEIKESVKDALQSNETPQEASTQTVYVPVEGAMQDNDVINRNYVAPCLLAKYRGLNVYCKGKNVWHNYSSVTSWYVPYSTVLFLLFVFIIWAMIKIWNSRG